ncbi:MAG TPA: ice-binding family protein [Rectinemataceae bacterium]|nr:ice-binding family protein [Rectinemataceae bacterium]
MKKIILLALLSIVMIVAGCKSPVVGSDVTAPTVSSTSPAAAATSVGRNVGVTATFGEEMDAATIGDATFTLHQGVNQVAGAVTYANMIATFDPAANLSANVLYTATITTGAKDVSGNALAEIHEWTFTTGGTSAAGPAAVNLRTAGDFAILTKAGIDTIPTSAVTGDIGVSPIDSTAITGFSLAMDGSNTFATSSQVVGKAYAANYVPPTPTKMTTAVSDMETAYTDAAGRATPDFIELASGEIGGLTLVPGLYKWGTDVLISNDVTLDGGPSDIWIFQISGGITQASGKRVNLTGGALPQNIFWQTFGPVALNTTAHFEGVVMSYTEITLATGASVNGRLLSQTAVTIDASTVTQPSL